MQKPLRRRGPTARQKEGAYRDSGSEPNRANRRKKQKRHSLSSGRSERPGYQDIERRLERQPYWDDDTLEYTVKRKHETLRRLRPRERYQSREQDRFRYQGLPDNYAPERARKAEKQYHKLRGHDYDLWEETSGRHRELYGEHPASLGRAEYSGSNKRHPGLLRFKNSRLSEDPEYYEDDRDDEYYDEHPNHKNSTRLAMEDYMNRRQFERTFHPMQIYDPVDSEYEREMISHYEEPIPRYRRRGHQSGANYEGFGYRGGRQQAHDWLNEDEYREGHAPRKRGYGKYGSR